MFRLLLIRNNNDDVLRPDSFESEGAAENVAKELLESTLSPVDKVVILRPIAEYSRVSTIERRPINAYGVKEPTQ